MSTSATGCDHRRCASSDYDPGDLCDMAPDMTPDMRPDVHAGRREPSQSRAPGSCAILRPQNGKPLRGNEGFGRFLGVETPERQAVSCAGTEVVQRYQPDAVSNVVVEQGQGGNDVIIAHSPELKLRDMIRLLRKVSPRKAAPHAVRLLSVPRERPSEHSAAEQCDELSTFHSITSPQRVIRRFSPSHACNAVSDDAGEQQA